MKQSGLTVTELTNLEHACGLERAIDRSVRRLVENAHREWNRRFAGKDPSDACVSVRIHEDLSATSKPARGSAFLKCFDKRVEGARKLHFAH